MFGLDVTPEDASGGIMCVLLVRGAVLANSRTFVCSLGEVFPDTAVCLLDGALGAGWGRVGDHRPCWIALQCSGMRKKRGRKFENKKHMVVIHFIGARTDHEAKSR